MSSKRETQQEEIRFRVLKLINENPKISTRDIARSVGISNGAAYYCLSALIKKGLVKFGNFASSKDKRKYAYLLTPSGVKEKTVLTVSFFEKKLKEFEDLKNEINELENEIYQSKEFKISK